MPFGYPDIFQVSPLNQDVEKKQHFGLELAKKHRNSFEAACVVFPSDPTRALWIVNNWMNDPIVTEARETLKAAELNKPILDKEQLAAKVLQFAEEKNADGTKYLVEAKDRIVALKLYSEIAGYTGKIDIDASTKNFTHNEMVIKLVKPDVKKEAKVIEAKPIDETLIENPLPLKIKLVG